ncbi:MAG: cell wall hydrolase [Lachnospiraceae bacterium]|nr:cell wall hydrolase [Lachnospiraceae bacterium]
MSIMADFINKVIVGIMTAYTAFCLSLSSAATPNYTQEDINLLAEVMYHENWNTDSEHLAAYYTGAVVMNRVKSKEWPNTIKEVLYQKGQYSTTKKFFTKEIPAECYELAEMILRDGTPDVPENVIFQSMRKLGKGTWKKVNTDYFCYG